MTPIAWTHLSKEKAEFVTLIIMIEASIIIPSYCGADRLPSLLKALTDQDFNGRFEVVVVLDGTTDDSAEAVRRFESRLRLRLVELPRNEGRATALNRGFDAATGTVLIRCDDDLAPQTDFVSQHVKWHRDRVDHGVVGLCRNVFPETAYARAYGRRADRRHREEAYARARKDQWLHWAGNCSVHRDMWGRIGPYDEGYRGYGWEDVDWGYRLWQAGGTIVLDPMLETEHRLAATSAAIRFDRAFQSGMARARFESLHREGGLWPLADVGVWGAVVRATARLPQPSAIHRAGAVLDSVMAYLPRAVAYRLTALGVDVAALAGLREGQSCVTPASSGPSG